MFDLIIANGSVIDGTGKTRFQADVAIAGDKIARIGNPERNGSRVLDAHGCIVGPGFIDIHAHTDHSIFLNPSCESKVTQGVTTEVSGNCGDSAFPLNSASVETNEFADALVEAGVATDWVSMDDFLNRVESIPKTINFATMIGHGSVRDTVLGSDDRPSNIYEMEEMKRLIRESVARGAFGLSSGLIYPPGCYAETEELIELAQVAVQYGGIYATHIRNEGDRMLTALDEAIRVGHEAGVPVQISHHKGCGLKARGMVKESLRRIDNARARGIDIWADQYPYTATSTSLATILPIWAVDGGIQSMLDRLRDPLKRDRLRRQLARDAGIGWIADWGGWDSIVISYTNKECNKRYEGLNITEMARSMEKEPVDAVMDLLSNDDGLVGVIRFAMDEADVETVMQHPTVLIGSDATARSTSGPMSAGKPHPRSFGTFVRVLGHYARDRGILALEEAVSKMTGKSARRLNLLYRGVLAEGNFADITIFDPYTVIDTATYAQPFSHAKGIKYVIVNGEIVVEDGRLKDVSETAPGRVLRRGQT